MPWTNEPLRALRRRHTKRVVILGPAAGGKSTIAELWLSWLIVNDPGPAAWNAKTDEAAKEFAETRIQRFLAACPRVSQLFPADRHKLRTQQIMFPHMSLVIQAANETNAQSKHLRYMISDETWQYDPGILAQLHKRTTRFAHSRKLLDLSTGSCTGDETDQAFLAGTRQEWQFCCPTCGAMHAPKWSDVHWDGKRDDGTWDYRLIRDTAKLTLGCGHSFAPSASVAYQLNKGGAYSMPNADAEPDIESYHWNAIATEFPRLGELAVEFVRAKEAVRRGTVELLREFMQKRLAEPWDDTPPQEDTVELKSNYRMGDVWPDEQVRFMTVDVQQDHCWIVVRAWKQGPESRLIWTGRAHGWSDVRMVQERYAVQSRFVFVDAGHFTDTVYTQCCLYDWTALKGEAAVMGYADGEEKIPVRMATGKGVPLHLEAQSIVQSCELLLVSDTLTSESLDLFRRGGAKGWTLPSDTPEFYLQQLRSRLKRQRREPRTGRLTWEWVTFGKWGEHLWDCERYQIAAAWLTGLMGVAEQGGA